eukprot:NODE_1021_length_2597_cov_0.482786.p3 type:complete len:161 gc:universal NODE_1021_length_2597_cov_0.482786:208-690(+)
MMKYVDGKINKLDKKLADITGYKYLPYSVVMKRVWAYVNEHSLKNGKLVVPDAKLTAAFNQTEPFELMSVLGKTAKGLMEDIKREEIPKPDLDKTMVYLQELQDEYQITFDKKRAKYEKELEIYNQKTQNIDKMDVDAIDDNGEGDSSKKQNLVVISSEE